MGSWNYETPADKFRERWNLHRFTVDAAASDANALVRPHDANCWMVVAAGESCPLCEHPAGRYYTEDTDGLKPEHYSRGDRVFCNPPYAGWILPKWVKLARELSRDAGVLWDMVLPVSTDAGWYQDYVWDDRTLRFREGVIADFPRGRWHFRDPERPEIDSPRYPNILVTFLPEPERK